MWDSGGGASRAADGSFLSCGAPAGLADSGQWARGTAPLVRKHGGKQERSLLSPSRHLPAEGASLCHLCQGLSLNTPSVEPSTLGMVSIYLYPDNPRTLIASPKDRRVSRGGRR